MSGMDQIGMFELQVHLGGDEYLARIIHECRRESFETEARRGFSQSKADVGVLAVRRGGRTRKASPGERIGRRSRYS
jgi:hypothetical protein